MEALPNDIILEISRRLFDDPASVINWALTNKSCYSIMARDLRSTRSHLYSLDITLVPSALTQAVLDRRKKVVSALGKYPSDGAIRYDYVYVSKGFSADVLSDVICVWMDTDDEDALIDVIEKTAAKRPRRATIYGGHQFSHVLRDEHVALLKGIPEIELLLHDQLTDAVFETIIYSSLCKIGGCNCFTGSNLPELMYSHRGMMLVDFSTFGWGPDRHLPLATLIWLRHQVNIGLLQAAVNGL